MKRYHEERHIAENRAKLHKNLNAAMDDFVASFQSVDPQWRRTTSEQVGRYRKSLRCGGCGRARCQVCHPEKFPRRVPTLQEKRPWGDGH